jgi:hypothetical protein
MKRWLALLLLAATASCSVDVEGAACRTPGATTDCPAGQACGTGLTCSVRAASCTPCVAGADGCRAGDIDLQTCSAAGDPACGTWTPKVGGACTQGLTHCAVPMSGAPVCACDKFVVDPAGFGTGSTCAFDAVATAIAAAQPFGVTKVWLGGAAGQTYGQAPADAAPLAIPDGVTVSGDDAPLAPSGRILEVQQVASATEGLRLGPGASLLGVTVRRATAAPDLAILVSGASPVGGASLESVRLDAAGPGGAFATGVRVVGTGDVVLQGVEVLGTTAAGLVVARDDGAQKVTATDTIVDGAALAVGSGVGVSLETGDLTLVRPEVKRSAGAGVVAGGVGTVRLTIQAGKLHDNLGIGISVQTLGRLAVTDTFICKNAGADQFISGANYAVGGIFAAGAAPSEQTFNGNRIFENGGHQVAIGLGSGTWNLDGPSGTGLACAGGQNAFAGYSTGYRGLLAAADVSAQYNAWPTAPPVVSVDVLKIGTPSVLIGTEAGHSFYCPLPSGLVCPPP